MLRNKVIDAKNGSRVVKRFLSQSSLTRNPTTASSSPVAAAAAATASKLASDAKTAATIAASSTTSSTAAIAPNMMNRLVDPTKSPEFLKNLPAMDLLSLTGIAGMTSSPGLIKMSTKIMKYTPNFLIKQFVYPIYCGGETFEEVVATGSKLLNRGFGNMMISYSVEDAEGSAGSELMDKAVDEIIASIDHILIKHYENASQAYKEGRTAQPPMSGYIALKPTGLMANAADLLKNYNKPEYAERWEAYLDVCRRICQHALTHAKGKAVIVFDAEKKILQPGVYEAQRAMMREFNKNGDVVVMGTIQMYLQDSVQQLEHELEDAKKHDYQVAMKLVRGAYTHSEPDRWNVIHKTKADTDASYNKGVSMMLDSIIDGWVNPGKGPLSNGLPLSGRVVVASHNEESMTIVDRRLREVPEGVVDFSKNESVVFGQLMGMAEDQGEELAKRGRKVFKYVPWGPTKETKDYLVRRLEENGDTVNVGGWQFVKYGLGEFKRRLF